jgi:hypothetical protein
VDQQERRAFAGDPEDPPVTVDPAFLYLDSRIQAPRRPGIVRDLQHGNSRRRQSPSP